MKNKNAKTPTDQLFFSKTWNFLNIYLVSQGEALQQPNLTGIP